MTTQTKLTASEKRAKAYLEESTKYDTFNFSIKWKKSRTWGANPFIGDFQDKNCVSVSGCGYCKLSTALADFLAFLFPPDTEPHRAIRRQGGAGEYSVMEALRSQGWALEKVYGDRDTDAYRLERIK